MQGNTVYVPKPELTFFQDTYLECEFIKVEDKNRYRLRVKSVLIGNGNPLPDLTARNEDSVIIVNKKKVYDSIESLKMGSKNLL